jgi:hypothetical protein
VRDLHRQRIGDERDSDISLQPSTVSGIAPFKMKQPKRRLDEQYQLAGAGGIEPPSGGIKIRLIIQRFQGAFGKTAKTRSSNFNSMAAVSK